LKPVFQNFEIQNGKGQKSMSNNSGYGGWVIEIHLCTHRKQIVGCQMVGGTEIRGGEWADRNPEN